MKDVCSYKSPIGGYLPHEEVDEKRPSFMQLSAYENIVLFHIAVYFSTLS